MDRSENFTRTERPAVRHTPDDVNIIHTDGDVRRKSPGQSRMEPCRLKDSLATPKTTQRIGTWNVRTMFAIGKTAQIMNEMQRYHLHILGISECRWTGSGKIKTSTGEIIVYSGREDDHHSNGVAIVMTKEASRSLSEWTPISDRIITARFWSKFIKTTIIQIYAPTNESEDEDKDAFYEQLQSVIENTPRHDLVFVIGDMNAKVGRGLDGEEGIIGLHGIDCDRNDNGERFTSFCAINNLAVVTTMFKHKDIHLQTWMSPNRQHCNQIDHVAVNGKYKRSVMDARVFRGADVGSDHNLVVIRAKLKLHRTGKKVSTCARYETCKLKSKEIIEKFKIELRNRFSVLEEQTTDNEIETQWETFKTAYNDSALKVLGPRQKKHQEWISAESWKRVDERKRLKEKINAVRSERIKERLGKEYSDKDKEVKKSMRRDKRKWIDDLAKEAEKAAQTGNMKSVYDVTKKLCKDQSKNIGVVKNKDGTILSKESEIRERWKEHFNEVLNRPEPTYPAVHFDNNQEALDIEMGTPSKDEIRMALRDMKCGKAPGVDNITAELLKADIETSVDKIHKTISGIWRARREPQRIGTED